MQLQKVPDLQPWNISGSKIINITIPFCEGFYGHLGKFLGLGFACFFSPGSIFNSLMRRNIHGRKENREAR